MFSMVLRKEFVDSSFDCFALLMIKKYLITLEYSLQKINEFNNNSFKQKFLTK